MEASRATTTAAPVELSQVLADYVTLTKPKVQLLLLLTTVTTMYVAGDPSAGLVALTVIGGSLSAGGAAAVNHYWDRDIDAQMARTATRPVPSGRVRPGAALAYGLVLAALSFLLLATTVNLLAAFLALSGFLGYVFVYTIWLKRSTPQNIVIGGAAGAVPPLVGWAAVTGGLDPAALYLFAIVFYWTPPHFWALSLLMKDEYARVGVPMMPVVHGETETRRQIVLYTGLLVVLTLLPVVFGFFGAIYAVAAVVLGGAFLTLVGAAAARAPTAAARCAPTCTRSPTSRCCSARWWSTRECSADERQLRWVGERVSRPRGGFRRRILPGVAIRPQAQELDAPPRGLAASPPSAVDVRPLNANGRGANPAAGRTNQACALGAGGGHLRLVLELRQPVQALGQVPVALAEQLHRGRQQHRPHDRRVDQDGRGKADAHLLHGLVGPGREASRT